MAITSKQMFRGPASLSNVTLYTVPAATSAVVTNIVLVNTSIDTEATVTVELAGVKILSNAAVAANNTITVDIKQLLSEFDILTAQSSSVDVNLHISGVEIS